jgi:peptide/nickel transport system substrate-binding protein
VPAYYTPDVQLERAYTRQLVSYPPSNNLSKANSLVADAATQLPTTGNGGITNGGKTYTFHIRKGVMWNTTPPRQVTSQDFLRNFKRFCNPVQPVGNTGYYESTIAGFSQYCTAEQNHFSGKSAPKATAASIASFQNSHQISGITAPNPSTLVFHLTEPASDFLNILAMEFASAAPKEWDNYVPDSAQFRNHVYSDGPYAITGYVPGKSITLTRNPAWKQSSDPIRHQYVNKIQVTMGTNSPNTALDDIRANTADLMGDLPVPTTSIPGLQASHNPGLHIWPSPNINPYLVFNLRSPDANKAMSKLKVRQAIEYAVNKVAVAKTYGGVKLNKPISTAIPPGQVGYSNFNLYPTPGNQGNPAKCKSLLAQAGYPHGFTILDAYRNAGVHPQVFQDIQGALAKCGITVKGVPQTESQYYVFLGNQPQNNKPNKWDISEPGWVPDWFGNNGRSTIQPLFQTNCTLNSTNWGCYSSKTTDSYIKQALAAPTQAAAAPLWQKADMQIMKDAAIVPITDQYTPLYHSSRVHNAIYYPPNQLYDVTQAWLSPNHP